ncbi:MAG: hypothetical protein R3B44_07895 [Candidatus Brocadiaceae bacterium]
MTNQLHCVDISFFRFRTKNTEIFRRKGNHNTIPEALKIPEQE